MLFCYRLKCVKTELGVGCSGVNTDTIQEAFDRIMEKHNIKIEKKYYQDGIYDGLLFQKYYAIDGYKVDIEIIPKI